MTNSNDAASKRSRLLIEDWLPIAALGEESVRERRSMTALPPTYYLHVWWARRPLVASRAAILASLLPTDADHSTFLHILGIHGDPAAVRARIDDAKKTGEDLGTDVYGYKRAFTYCPSEEEIGWMGSEFQKLGLRSPSLLDPTAGGGSIPFEGRRLGLDVVANDLNPVAWLILKATVEYPFLFGETLLRRFQEISRRFLDLVEGQLSSIYPAEETGSSVDGYLWARTIKCPYCGGLVPLSPNWRLDSTGTGVQLIPSTDGTGKRQCSFNIVSEIKDHSAGTIKAGNALCPFPDCGRVIDGDEHIKPQAQAGHLGHQLYAIANRTTTETTLTERRPGKKLRGFRSPTDNDLNDDLVQQALSERIREWEAANVVPSEEIDTLSNYDRGHRLYGIRKWQEFFSSRQLISHCVNVEAFHTIAAEAQAAAGGTITDLDRAALTYLSFSIDKFINFNCTMTRWDKNRGSIVGKFDSHNYSMKWSYAEMAPAITGGGLKWVIEQTSKALRELIEMAHNDSTKADLFERKRSFAKAEILHGPASSLCVESSSIDCIVMDPPYYDNVMYAELSDFFYVWLKRTAGVIHPEQFTEHLTDKDREAIANPAKFKGRKGGAKNLAGLDYQHRMADIFTECRRVLKVGGVMTVMFTHKASGAWDALANGLVQAGFVITASWPVNTEAEGSLHIKEKSAAKSTIFLVCRPREERTSDETIYWEDVEPQVKAKVRERVGEFQTAGIGGVDLYLACFGPALQVFSENWPLKRGRPVQQPKKTKLVGEEEWDAYGVRPEDALDAARMEVKRWRMEQLATVKRQHHLDPLTEWFVLAWDAFKAPRFPSDEALKLARVVGLDFDKDVKNVVCEVKSSDVVIWDSKTRQSKSKLGPVGEDVMLDTLHHAALIGREQNTGAAQTVLEEAGLLKDSTLLTALEALLNVLPAPGTAGGKKKDDTLGGAASDCEALEKLRRLALSEEVPEPKFTQRVLFVKDATDEEDDEDGEE